MKLECPTFLRSKGKAMAVTLSDHEVSDNAFGSDEDGTSLLSQLLLKLMKVLLLKRTLLMGNSLRMQICKNPTISFAKLLQRML